MPLAVYKLHTLPLKHAIYSGCEELQKLTKGDTKTMQFPSGAFSKLTKVITNLCEVFYVFTK